ncbi:MAG: ABC transporter permease [Actinobacteria bacterium]|nr:ABC transporter permease [Actinomycetota bacterium]
MTTAEASLSTRSTSTIGDFTHWLRRSPGVVAGALVLIAVIAGFSILRPETFFTVDNAKIILNQTAVGAIVAAGVSIALVAGQYDLSVGATVALASVITADVANLGVPWWVAVLGACGTGAVVGLANGVVVVGARVPSIVTTLGTQTILLGLISWFTNNAYIRIDSPTMATFGRGTVLNIPNTAWVMFAVCIVGALLMRYTIPGRNLQAVGRNPEASRLAGINVDFYSVAALVTTGVLVAVAGVVLSAQLGAGHPEVSGGYLLPAFAAAFLGAAVSRTGTATFIGALYGALLLQCVTNGLIVSNAPSWSQEVVQGAILILAVAVSQMARLRARTAGA